MTEKFIGKIIELSVKISLKMTNIKLPDTVK